MSTGYWVRNHRDDCLVRTWDLATSEDCTCWAEPERVETPEAYMLVKDGNVWDCSNLMADMDDWTRKILREEPDAVIEVKPCTLARMMIWKGY